MKIEYDSVHDLLYVWFAEVGTSAARTETLAPGVHVDFDSDDRLVGFEVLEAKTVLGTEPKFELALKSAS